MCININTAHVCALIFIIFLRKNYLWTFFFCSKIYRSHIHNKLIASDVWMGLGRTLSFEKLRQRWITAHFIMCDFISKRWSENKLVWISSGLPFALFMRQIVIIMLLLLLPAVTVTSTCVCMCINRSFSSAFIMDHFRSTICKSSAHIYKMWGTIYPNYWHRFVRFVFIWLLLTCSIA